MGDVLRLLLLAVRSPHYARVFRWRCPQRSVVPPARRLCVSEVFLCMWAIDCSAALMPRPDGGCTAIASVGRSVAPLCACFPLALPTEVCRTPSQAIVCVRGLSVHVGDRLQCCSDAQTGWGMYCDCFCWPFGRPIMCVFSAGAAHRGLSYPQPGDCVCQRSFCACGRSIAVLL